MARPLPVIGSGESIKTTHPICMDWMDACTGKCTWPLGRSLVRSPKGWAAFCCAQRQRHTCFVLESIFVLFDARTTITTDNNNVEDSQVIQEKDKLWLSKFNQFVHTESMETSDRTQGYFVFVAVHNYCFHVVWRRPAGHGWQWQSTISIGLRREWVDWVVVCHQLIAHCNHISTRASRQMMQFTRTIGLVRVDLATRADYDGHGQDTWPSRHQSIDQAVHGRDKQRNMTLIACSPQCEWQYYFENVHSQLDTNNTATTSIERSFLVATSNTICLKH